MGLQSRIHANSLQGQPIAILCFFKGLEQEPVTGAKVRARTRTRDDAANAKLSQKNHLQASPARQNPKGCFLARTFAPVTILRYNILKLLQFLTKLSPPSAQARSTRRVPLFEIHVLQILGSNTLKSFARFTKLSPRSSAADAVSDRAYMAASQIRVLQFFVW